MPDRDKHTSSFGPFINYEENKVFDEAKYIRMHVQG